MSGRISRGAAARRLGDLRRAMAPQTGRGRNLGYWRIFAFLAANALTLFPPGRYFEPRRKVTRRWPEATVENALGRKDSPARAAIEALVDRHGTDLGERIYTAIAEGMNDGERWTLKHRRLVSDDEAARRLLVDSKEREELGLRSIGGVDSTSEVRKLEAQRRKRERDRERMAAKRRAAGAQRREEYEGDSISKSRPWEALGVSRATYFRRVKARNGQAETSASLHNRGYFVSSDNSLGDTLVSGPSPPDDPSIDERFAKANNPSSPDKFSQLAARRQSIAQRLPAPQALIVGDPKLSLSERALLAVYAREKAAGWVMEVEWRTMSKQRRVPRRAVIDLGSSVAGMVKSGVVVGG